jgi:predicted metal-binding membrane protein
VFPHRSEPPFYAVAVLVFVASAAATVSWGASMAATGGMPMPGGWTMSMAWMRMPGQSWPGSAASFVAMWVVMTTAMMLPSLVLMLRRYRRAVAPSPRAGLNHLTLVVSLGYFAVWAAIGLAIFPIGVSLAELSMRQPALARAVPMATGMAVLLAGAGQFTSWKMRHLVGCMRAAGRGSRLTADTPAAWRHGLCLGRHCSQACAGLTVVMLVGGVMDLTVIAAVASAITIERCAPLHLSATRVIGAAVIAAGVHQMARAAGL